MKESKLKQQEHCKDPKKHLSTHTFICITCASKKNINFAAVCFCAECYKNKFKDHESHKQLCRVQTKTFINKLNLFKDYIKNNTEIFDIQNDHNLKILLKQNKLSFDDKNFKKWLIQSQFWKLLDKNTEEQARTNLIQLSKTTCKSPVKKQHQSQQSFINWQKCNNQGGDSMFQQMLKQASKQKQKLQLQKKIIDLLIEAYCSQTESSKQMIRNLVDTRMKQHPQNSTLLLIKLYLTDIHKQNENQWRPILEKLQSIESNFKNSMFQIFIQSHKFWVKLDKRSAAECKDVKFVDIGTGHIYKLTNPQQYVNLLKKAKESTSPILEGLKGLGLIAEGKHTQANKIFQNILKLSQNQSFLMNAHYSRVMSNKIASPSQNLLQEIQNKSKQYIKNLIRWLKRQKMFQQIIMCCQALKFQKNDSTYSKIQLVKAFLKINCIEQAEQVKNTINSQKLSSQIKQKLQRKEIYARARLATELSDYQKCTRNCLELMSQKKSASALYSLASSYYNEQKWDEAQQSINKALAIKSNQKYKKLKIYILINKRQLDSAKKLLAQMQGKTIDDKIKEMLHQFA